MNDESTQRISKTTAIFMVTVAVLFDLAQLACKILTIIGLTVLTGTIAVIACNWAGIDFPKLCAITGSGVGAVVSLIPVVGQALALKVGIIMDWLASSLFAITGYAVMHMWFHMKDVSIFSGNSAAKKVGTTIVSFLVDAIPFLSALPGITTWTITMIVITRSEDKQKAKEAETRYNEQDSSRMRRPLRRYVRTATTF